MTRTPRMPAPVNRMDRNGNRYMDSFTSRDVKAHREQFTADMKTAALPRRKPVLPAALLFALALAAFGQEGDTQSGPAPASDGPFTAGEAAQQSDPFASSGETAAPDDPFAGEDDPFASGDDPFDTSVFEEAVQESVASEDTARIDFLAGGTFAIQGDILAAESFDAAAFSSGLSGKAFLRVTVPDYGTLFGSYAVNHTFLSGVSGDRSALPVRQADPFTPQFTLSELHYSFDIRKVLFVRIGNQLIAWGPSRIWSPVDFINLQRFDAFGAVDVRSGKPGIRLHLPFSSANVFAFADFSGTAANGSVKDPLDTIALGGRADAALGDFEFGVTAYGGASTQLKLGLDATGRLLGTTVYGEAAWAPGYDAYEASFQGSAGFSRALDADRLWTLSGEFFYNSKGGDYTGSMPPPGAAPLYVGAYYGYAALSAADLLSESLDLTFSGLANFSDLSWTAKLSGAVSIRGIPPFTAALSWNSGGDGKEFTSRAGNNSFAVSLSTRLEF